MSTPEQKIETLNQIADRIAYKYLDRTFGSAKLKSDILSALRNERERCMNIVAEGHSGDCDDDSRCEMLDRIIKAIREGR